MAILVKASDWIMPIIIVAIIVYGLLKNVNVYEAFIEGASAGIKVILDILPTLVGLMVAVGMLRSSGALDGLCTLIRPLISWTKFPVEAIPTILMRTFSSSAATGLMLDIYKNFSPDSFIGRYISIMFGCTETVFYTMSVYYMTIKIKKSRYTLAGALFATFAGVMVAYYLTLFVFGV